jgi:hypothetical protein
MRRQHGPIAAIITDRLGKNEAGRRKSNGPHVWANRIGSQYDLGREVGDEQHSCDGQTKTIHSLEGDSMKTRIPLRTLVERGYR